MTPCLLGLDIGTTNAKAVLLSPHGKIMGEARERYGVSFPRPGWAEQNPEIWWRAVCRLAHRLKRDAPQAFPRIAAIGVSGQGCPLVALGRNGKCLRPAILWLDTRAADETAWMESEAGNLLLRTNGNRVGAYNVEPKALWLRKHEPKIFARTFKFLTTVGYVNFRLTGEPVLNHSDGGILFAYDPARRAWSEELLAKLGIPQEKYPRLAECHEVVGKVTPQAAKESGLAPGTLVVAGGEDSSSAALAAGAVEAGQAFLSLGTAAVLGVVLRQRVNEPRLLSFPHVLPGRTLLNGSMSSAGASLEWYVRNWYAPAPGTTRNSNPFRALDREAARSRPGSGALVFLPYLSGELHPILDAQARAVLFGLALDHRRGDVVRSLMEGCAFAIRHNLTIAEAAEPRRGEGSAGAVVRVREIHATGGPTKSSLWCQIISDVTGCELVLSQAGPPEGSALLAGWGAGLMGNPAGLVTEHLQRSRIVQPRRETRDIYDRLFHIYRELYTRLKDQFPVLRELRSQLGGKRAAPRRALGEGRRPHAT